MNPLLVLVLVSTTTVSRPLTPYETQLYRSLGECKAKTLNVIEDIKTCRANLDHEKEERTKAEKRVVETPVLDAPSSSLGSRLLHILVPSGGAALGGVVASLICDETNQPPGRAALITGGVAGAVALISAGIVEVVE
jgi:hypothetical protein